MHKRSKILIAGFLSLGLIGSAAAYHRFSHNHHGHINHIQDKLTKKLDLNQNQSTALKQLTDSVIDSRKALISKNILDVDNLLSLLESDQLDQARALSIVRKQLSAIESQAQQLITTASEFTDSLNNKQRSELTSLLEKRIQHRKHHIQG